MSFSDRMDLTKITYQYRMLQYYCLKFKTATVYPHVQVELDDKCSLDVRNNKTSVNARVYTRRISYDHNESLTRQRKNCNELRISETVVATDTSNSTVIDSKINRGDVPDQVTDGVSCRPAKRFKRNGKLVIQANVFSNRVGIEWEGRRSYVEK